MASITTEIGNIQKSSSFQTNTSPETNSPDKSKTKFSFYPEPSNDFSSSLKNIESIRPPFKPNNNSFRQPKTQLNILAELKIDHSFFSTLFRSKWSEKKEFLDKAAGKCKNVRLSVFGGEETAFVEAVGKLLKDVNVNVCVSALNVLREMAHAAGERFEPCARRLFAEVVLKFREKRKGVGEVCFEVLEAFVDAVFFSSD